MLFAQRVANQRHIILMKVVVSLVVLTRYILKRKYYNPVEIRGHTPNCLVLQELRGDTHLVSKTLKRQIRLF